MAKKSTVQESMETHFLGDRKTRPPAKKADEYFAEKRPAKKPNQKPKLVPLEEHEIVSINDHIHSILTVENPGISLDQLTDAVDELIADHIAGRIDGEFDWQSGESYLLNALKEWSEWKFRPTMFDANGKRPVVVNKPVPDPGLKRAKKVVKGPAKIDKLLEEPKQPAKRPAKKKRP